MIERYSRKQLTDIWSEENKYQIWLDVEVAAAEAMEKMGQGALLQTEDKNEGIDAFLTKRKPVFKGK